MRGVAALPGVIELTPEDPAAESSTDLLNRQAADVAALVNSGFIDEQARIILMTTNTGAAAAQSGLERIRNEPIPVHYDFFIRALAWFFGVMAFNRLDAATENHIGSVVVGVLMMTTFVVAERVGGFIENPMSNTVFDIPMYRICAIVSGNLLGAGHPLAQPPQGEKSIVWMGGSVARRRRHVLDKAMQRADGGRQSFAVGIGHVPDPRFDHRGAVGSHPGKCRRPLGGDSDAHRTGVVGVRCAGHQTGLLEPAHQGCHRRLRTVVQLGELRDAGALAAVLDGAQQPGLSPRQRKPDTRGGQPVEAGDHRQQFRPQGGLRGVGGLPAAHGRHVT